MATFISLLRGINVSGQKKIKMDELKKLYDSLGFKKVQTYIQSGNVVFECHDASIPKITERIKKKIKESFGFDVIVLIRTKEEFKKITRNNPFSKKLNQRNFLLKIVGIIPWTLVRQFSIPQIRLYWRGREYCVPLERS